MDGHPIVGRLPVAAANDSARLASLFDAHHDRLYGLARRLTPSTDDALDLVQETFHASRQAVLAVAFAATPAAVSRFSFARLATVSVVVVGIFLLGSLLWPRMGFETYADVRFEVRLAEDAPGPGLREAKVAGSERVIYLHDEIVVSNGDIDRAEMLPGRDGLQFVVGVYFTPEGARKMRAASQGHIGKPVAILIDGDVVMAPMLRSPIGDSAEINGNYTREQAERIVNGLH